MSNDVARYRRLYNHEWHEPEFRRLNDGARIVRFYVTAGPQTTSVGCFRLSTALAVEDLGGTAEAFEERLETVCEAFGWAWDPLARVIWIRDWFENNPPASPNVVVSWAKLLKNVPSCDVKDEAIIGIAASLKNLPNTYQEPFKELSRTSRRTEVKTKVHSEVHSETNQGAGIRELRSESKRTGGLRPDGTDRNEAKTTNKPTNPRLVSIADQMLELIGTNAPREVQINSLQDFARREHVEARQRDAEEALDFSLSKRRTA